MMYNNYTLVSDIDGILTDGGHFYNNNGKFGKKFGSNDKDSIRKLKSIFKNIIFCSADKTGYDINKLRMEEIGVDFQFCTIEQRQELINNNLPCVYIGDGIAEPNATINIALEDSTPQAKEQSDWILPTIAGKNVFPHLLHYLENENVINFAHKILNCVDEDCKIILTGIGKNFSLAQLVSEFFLPFNWNVVPIDANHSTHGSLGIIKEHDVVIASSKSGNTIELANMMKALKRKMPSFKNTFIITSNKNCKICGMFEHKLFVPYLKEDSLFGLSPQTTIKQYLGIYFTILNVLNSSSNIKREDYLLNHQGGSIGSLLK